MNKVRKKILFLSIMAVMAFVAGIFTSFSRPQATQESPASLKHYYNSISELAASSPLVVEVVVETDPSTINFKGMLFSTNQVRVTREFKGPGGLKNLLVLDNGGIYQGKEYGMGGAPLLHTGERYVLFLYKYQGPVTSNEAYVIRGVWQGKMKITPNGALQYVGLPNENLELQQNMKQFNIATFKDQIR